MKNIPLAELTLDPRLQMRCAMSPEAVAEYAENLDKLPPGKVFLDEDGKYLLWDGWHHYEACKLRGQKTMPCEVEKGGFVQALFAAAGANYGAGHGVRMTNEDKRKAVLTILVAREELDTNWSNNAIAASCHVTHTLVNNLAAEREQAKKNEENNGQEEGKSETDSSGTNGQAETDSNSSRQGRKKKERKAKSRKTNFCDRCLLVGPMRNCPECAKLRDEKKKSRGKKPKQGTEAFSLKTFNEHLSRALAEMDKLAHEFGVLNGRGQPTGPEHAGLGRQVAEVRKAAEKWFKQLQKQGKPGF